MSTRDKNRALVRYRAAFEEYLAAIDEHWGAADAEELHDLRVGLRRTRSLLANAKGVVPRRDRERFTAFFRDLAHATTLSRDLDVAVDDWPELVQLVDPAVAPALASVRTELRRRQQVERAALSTKLRSSEVHEGLADWRSWLEGERFDARRAKHPIEKVVNRERKRSRKRLKQLAAVDTIEGRHEWRKKAKRLRYLLEAFPRKRHRKLLRRLVDAQEMLGRERDHLVQARLMESIGTDAALTLATALRAIPPAKDPRF